ncbi:hypothetical protein C8R47DRAFT_1135715 [Mycena vitilis]|nr:hypothetical protein C8R47DRAFT_1135715 [Mycena vitilis]
MCLERGAQYTLSLSAFLAGNTVRSLPVLGLLMQHSDRWQSVDLTVTSKELDMLQQPEVQGRPGVKILERLFLYIIAPGLAEVWNDNTGIFFDAPRLKHVFISSLYSPNVPRLPWKQLHTFSFSTPRAADNLCRIMALMSNLCHLEAALELHDVNGYYLQKAEGPSPDHIINLLLDLPRGRLHGYRSSARRADS